MDGPLRCPHCHAQVVDRRSPSCTTCNQALPADWIMTKDQAAKVAALDQDAREQYRESIKTIDSIVTDASVRYNGF